MKDKRTVSLRLTQDAYDALQALARQNDRSVEGQVRALVTPHLHQNFVNLLLVPKAYDALQALAAANHRSIEDQARVLIFANL